MATRKRAAGRDAGTERTIKTTVQMTPQNYERLGALVARRRAAGESIDRSKLIATILDSELRRYSIAIRSIHDAEDAGSRAVG